MQFKLLSTLLLASSFLPSVLAAAPPAIPASLSARHPVDLDNVGNSINNVVDNTKDFIDDTTGKIAQWYQDLKNFNWPNVSDVIDDIDKWFDGVKDKFKSFPEEAWEKIKKGEYPPEVQDWVNKFPENLRDSVKKNLRELAEDQTSDASRAKIGMSFVGAAVAMVVVLTM